LGDPAVSLINKMLLDLDKRHAPQAGLAAPDSGGLVGHVRATSSREVSPRLIWLTIALSALLALSWVAWVVWQPAPNSPVTARALAPSPAMPPKEAAGSPALPTPGAEAVIAQAEAPVSQEVSNRARADSEPRIAQAPSTPGRNKTAEPRSAPESAVPAPLRRAKPSSSRPKTAKSSVPPVQAAEAGDTAESGKIDRRSSATARDRAEDEFRRGAMLVNQGRLAEGTDSLRGALEIDPQHEAARQTLVALLVEARRVDEAVPVLQQGLALNAQNTAFAVLLARIMVERNDVPGALSLLQKHAAPQDRSPEFHAFAAALYQRLDRHAEAIERYQTALRLAPSAGVWWLGLGISHQAAGQPKEAREAFTRAKSAGNLSPDLTGFVDQRLRQLQ
jgi:MSHA biogenesis protein MshN